MKTNTAIFAFAALLGIGVLSGKAEATCRYQCTDMGINHSKPLLSYFFSSDEAGSQNQVSTSMQSASNEPKLRHSPVRNGIAD